ncbi:MAG: PEP-CTERM sorting domain-containing protein [Aquabacterium sp.]|jgi:hypothetical protein|nr:PEP-CTERM sorting domain-containing protein [Aquabacterium sp.]MDX9844784.1 PEP-CTERM sorting domain-containing protein [Aquabacterium sp.]
MSDMVRMGLRPASLALAASLCFGVSAQAATDPIVSQATLSLSGLSFQLIDLTPGDGIAPSLSFQTQGRIDTWQTAYDEATDTYSHVGPQFQNSLLPSTPLNYVGPDGLSTVTSTANSVTLQSQIPLSQILPSVTPPNVDGIDDYLNNNVSTSTDLAVGEFSPEALQPFTLSAGTVLVVRGTLSGSFALDATALQAELTANGYADWSLYHSAYSDGAFIMAAQLNDLADASGVISGLSGSQVNGIVTNFWNDGTSYLSNTDGELLRQVSASKDFEFTLTNLGSSDMTGVLALSLMAGSNLSLSASRPGLWTPPIDLPPIDVPAIPEPATYALMGLGLVGIAAVARRRRHTA